jgi:hypothetical protein
MQLTHLLRRFVELVTPPFVSAPRLPSAGFCTVIIHQHPKNQSVDYQPIQAAIAAITKSNLLAKPADRAGPG